MPARIDALRSFFSVGFKQRRWRFSFPPFVQPASFFYHIQVARCRFGLRSHRRPAFRSLERCQSHSVAAFGMLWCHCQTSSRRSSFVAFVEYSTLFHPCPIDIFLLHFVCEIVKHSAVMWEFINALLHSPHYEQFPEISFLKIMFVTFSRFAFLFCY